MRPLPRHQRPPTNAPLEQRVEWLMQRFDEIMLASQTEDSAIADPFKVDNPQPPRRTIDASAATLAELREAFATFLTDMKQRGMNRKAG